MALFPGACNTCIPVNGSWYAIPAPSAKNIFLWTLSVLLIPSRYKCKGRGS